MSLQQTFERVRSHVAVQAILGSAPFMPRGALLSMQARNFMLANEDSPVVFAAGRADGGTHFVLADLKRFELSARDIDIMPMPIWGETE